MLTSGGPQKLLGISIGERSALVAEVAAIAARTGSGRVAEFVYPAEVGIDHPETLGQALGIFLRANGFTSHRAVFGVPAKWLIWKPYALPATDSQTAGNILWLFATEQISPELGEMNFDYVGEISSTEVSPLLLVGLQKRWMERLEAMARGAELKLAAITPIGAALAAASAPHIGDGWVLSLRPERAELAMMEEGRIRSLAHLGAASGQPLLAAIRRAEAGAPKSSGGPRRVAIWDEWDTEKQILDAIPEIFGAPGVEATARWVNVDRLDPSSNDGGGAGLSAAALTFPQRSGIRPTIDFLHSRLTPPRPQGRHKHQWIAAAAAVLLLAAGSAVGFVIHLQRQIDATNSRIFDLQPKVDIAKPFVASMEFAEAYEPHSPRFIACLSDLTLAVPADSQTYFVSMSLGADMHGEVVGRATGEQDVLNFVDKMKASGKFGQINTKLDPHESRGGRGPADPSPMSFTILFAYLPGR